MMSDIVTMTLPMAKSNYIQLRVNDDVKRAIEIAAANDNRSVSNWLLKAAGQANPEVSKAINSYMGQRGAIKRVVDQANSLEA